MANKAGVPKNVLVQGQQCPVSVDDKDNVTTALKDPKEPIKNSPYKELLPATEEWVKKYGGSDISIVAYNVSVLLEKENAKKKAKHKNY